MQQTELEYTAGLFDGRGTITLWKPSTFKHKLPMVRLTVTKKRYPLLDFLQKTYGGCVSNCDKEDYRRYWTVTCDKAVEFLKAIRPHTKLLIRQQQIDALIDMPTFRDNSRPTKQELRVRKAFEKEWKKLKKGKIT